MSAEQREQLGAFVGAIRDLGAGITGAAAGGTDLNTLSDIESLAQLKFLDESERAWVREKGRLLQEKLVSKDIDGALTVLRDLQSEYAAGDRE